MITNHTSPEAGISQCDRILAELQRHAGHWVSIIQLAAVSGSMAVHSRISDLRGKGHHIDHRNERRGRMVHSSYRLGGLKQPTLF
jgi:hypothetical protein